MIEPGVVTGDKPLAAWLRRLRNYVISLRIQPGQGYRVNYGTTGTTLEILPGAGGGGGLGLFRFKGFFQTYITAKSWNGTTEGELVKIAIPADMRSTFTSATIDNVPVTYDNYTSAQTRRATSQGTSETQVIVPRYTADCEIWATSVDTLLDVGSPAERIKLLDVNVSGRAFSEV